MDANRKKLNSVNNGHNIKKIIIKRLSMYSLFLCIKGDKMTKEYLMQNSIIGAVFGNISAFLGGFDLIIRLLCVLVICDYITGIMASRCEKTPISSKVGFKVIRKKSVVFMLVGVSYCIDLTIGTPVFRNLTIMFL